MLRALAGRLAFALVLVVAAFVAAFVVTAVAPGDAIDAESLPRAAVARERERLGLDRPVMSRLGERLVGLVTFDLGESSSFDRPVLPLVIERTAATLKAGGTALGLAVLVGIPLGVTAARTQSRALRVGIASTSVLLLSTPALLIALVLGIIGTTAGLPSLVVMTVSLALPAAALLERLQARAMASALEETCLRAAEARGVPRARVTWLHAWPLSLPAVLGVASIVASHLLSGALAIELLTNRPGLGMLTWQALLGRDVNLAAGCAGMAALLVGAVTLVGDVVQLAVDPRLAGAHSESAGRVGTEALGGGLPT